MSVQIGTPRLRLSSREITRIADESLEYHARLKGDEAKCDLWGKDEQQRPVSSVFVLAHEIFCQIDYFDQVIWFNRAEERDELWAITDAFTGLKSTLARLPADAHAGYIDDDCQQCACVISVPRDRSFDQSLIDLLSCYFSTAAGAPSSMERLIATGYISRAQFELLFQRVLSNNARREREHQAWTEQAHEKKTEIIHVARELGLRPEPAGTGPVQWYANCPQTSHRLMITTGHEQFGCGYCCVKGGIEELREFVDKRNAQREKRA